MGLSALFSRIYELERECKKAAPGRSEIQKDFFLGHYCSLRERQRASRWIGL